MKLIKSLIAGITVCCLVCANVATVSAVESTLHVTTPGGSAFSTNYSTVMGANHTAGVATLKSYQFNGWYPNSMPYDSQGNYYRINTRLYVYNNQGVAVSEAAHYNCANQQRSMTYYSGYGTVGATYMLKTNSSYNAKYDATFEWSA